MTWPDNTPSWLKQAYGVITAGVNNNMSTAELIDSLRPYAEASPEGWGPSGVTIVSQLRGMAAAIRQARSAVSAAGMQGSLEASHIALAPWSRGALERSAAPQYDIRVNVSYANPASPLAGAGEPGALQRWVTVHFSSLPSRLDILAGQSSAAAHESGSVAGEITDVLDIEILEVLCRCTVSIAHSRSYHATTRLARWVNSTITLPVVTRAISLSPAFLRPPLTLKGS